MLLSRSFILLAGRCTDEDLKELTGMIVSRGRMLLAEVREKTSQVRVGKGKGKLQLMVKMEEMLQNKIKTNQKVNVLGGGKPSTILLSFICASHLYSIFRSI